MSGFRCFAGLAVVCLPAVFAGPASGQEDTIGDQVVQDIQSWASSPVVFLTLEASNARYADLDQAGIEALDKQWRDERGKADQPLITAVLSNPLSSYLTKIQAGSHGLYTEIFVMDAKGLNAGQSAITSDFWQGDEAKWQKTYLVGPDAVFIDEVELNEELGTENAQVNLSIVHKGQLLGAITVEVNVTELRRRRDAGKV
ncbi:hypothetical protein [Denitrobaculum tricleocarpae]|uniref:Uncharacterized protein n=1 Tax=Denitrobaculum tricleocarpae TaxID=2591009 RepID=A0A545U0S9_9PROT|nr:hypothetical protein [Denitrobaculum tricleocarpae]TQV83066.1 hypothetical protein FKG95_00205 [Denitrobaculum tricleocarpae]